MKRSKLLRGFGSFAACALSAGALAACGGGGGAATLQPITRAADVSATAPGYKMSLNEHLTSSALSGPVTITGTGSIDSRSKTGKISLDLAGIPGAAQAGAPKLEAIIQNLTFYMHLPPVVARRLPGGKSWMKLDLNAAGQAAGLNLSSLSNFSTSDPSQFLHYLKAASGGIQKLGSESVRGVQTTHYKATLDLDKYPSLVPSAERQQAQTSITALEKLTNLHKIPVDVWIDDQHLVRRMHMAFTETPAGGRIGLDMVLEFFSFGPQAAVQIPPASSVFDATQLATQSIKKGK